MSALEHHLSATLAVRSRDQLLRVRRSIAWQSAVECTIEGRACVAFCSNDYLGLARDPDVRAAAAAAAAAYGAGAGAARLIAGEHALLHELEQELAAWKGTQAALVFPSGYMANLGVIAALAGPGDRVVVDRLAHASIIDGVRLSRARLNVFPHNDVERLSAILARPHAGRTLVVTESVFSMDGDCAPLAALAACAEAHGAILIVDEAHALGVYGNGRGLAAELGLTARIGALVGTLSKALGSQGGFVCGSRLLVEYLVNSARPFVYTTGLAPACAGAALAALRIVRNDHNRIARLWDNVQRVRAGLRVQVRDGNGPIIPVLCGSAAAALHVADGLLRRGYLAPAIRPPTVPHSGARVRLTISAAHTPAHCDGLLAAIHSLLDQR
jgi:8-amino-7-oxononanoate synthase